jgi:CheY-like chemotaxis protein
VLWTVRADKAQLESALLNLVINARDAMPDGGELVVETANITIDDSDPELTAGDYAVVAVSDSGEGMSPEVLAKASEPFFTTKPVGKGSGLGLSMVYGFARQSGGQLKIYSEAGHGSTIRLYLPRSGGAIAPPAAQRLDARARGNGETVLVVEDNAPVLRVAVRQIEDLGYRVLQARSGPDALALMEAETAIDVVFTDIVMPGGMTGVELVEAARQRRPGLRVVFATGFATAAARGADKGIGSDRLINKPYRRSDLAAVLREALDDQIEQEV